MAETLTLDEQLLTLLPSVGIIPPLSGFLYLATAIRLELAAPVPSASSLQISRNVAAACGVHPGAVTSGARYALRAAFRKRNVCPEPDLAEALGLRGSAPPGVRPFVQRAAAFLRAHQAVRVRDGSALCVCWMERK